MITGNYVSFSRGTTVPCSVRSEPTRSTVVLAIVFLTKSLQKMLPVIMCHKT